LTVPENNEAFLGVNRSNSRTCDEIKKMTESISAIAKTLSPVVKVLSPKLRRLYKERKAARMPIGDISELLEKGMDETLDRLTGGKGIDEWWKGLLNKIGHEYISPKFLRIQAINEWLSDPQVQTDFKSLAREHIMGQEAHDQDIYQRLRQTYSAKTGENEMLANGPIGIIVAIIAAGYIGSISPEIEPVAGMMQDHDRQSKKAFQELRGGLRSIEKGIEKISLYHYTEEAHNKIAQQELDKLLKRRSVEPARTQQEIIALTKRVFEGDLVYAAISIKAEIFYWASRLHASKTEALSLTKEYLIKLIEIDAEKDTRIIDALILETEGDTDGALRKLRDIDNADGRSTFFVTCKRINGKYDALLWFNEQPGNDNPEFFTGIGWFNLAATLAETEKWSEAAQCLAVVSAYWEKWPDLAFLEGIANTALLLPEELRTYALEMRIFYRTIRPIEGSAADKYRARAKECFDTASKLLIDIDLKGRAQVALDWHLWLRLTDPKTEISQNARQEISESMKEGPKAVDSIIFARTFGIEFDENPLKKYLAQRKRTGGLENNELVAEFLMAEMKMSPRDRVDFLLKEEERFTKVVSKDALSVLIIESLVEDGQTKRARKTLEERKDYFVEQDFRRIEIMIDAKDGADPREKLEDLYTKDDSLINLQNFVSHLKRIGDWNALQPKLEELFQKERTAENAHMLAYCYRRNARLDFDNILAFLDKNYDLVDGNDDLLSEKAWTLSHSGFLKKAREITAELLKKRENEDDLLLEINIALQLGDWDRFSAIISDAMKRKENLRPDMLIHLASLSSEVDSDANRAIDLARMAVDKGGDDPQILIQAYFLAVQLGREDQESGEWFGRAIELSSDDGPLKKVDIRTLAEEMMPAHRERARAIEQGLMKGEISLQDAAKHFGQSLSRILVEIPKINKELNDGRRRIVVPIRSGSRGIVPMKSDWKVCLDITSIMVLNHIDILQATITGFEKIVLDPDTMVILLNEKRRARYHQPFRIKIAEDFRSLLDRNLIKTASLISDPPNELIEEVGKDFAELLSEAKAAGGLVIMPCPIHKIRSFLEREANLGEYSDYILSTKAFVKILHKRKGLIDSEEFERANLYLAAQDRGGRSDEDQSLIDCPLYIDELSITYLQHVNLLNVICNSGLDISVHPSTRAYNAAIIEEGRGGIRLAKDINNIRFILHKALMDGKATFLPRPRWGDRDEQFKVLYQIAPTVINLIEDTGDCSAVCIDDRFFNKHINVADKKNRSIPTVCVTDILHHLKIQSIITEHQMNTGFHKLRQAGFAFVPLLFEEMSMRLSSTSWNDDGSLIESAEMRMMRQSLMRIRSLEMISLPEEALFLQQIQLCSALTIRKIWSDESVPEEKARELSNWIWQNIAPSPLDWVKDLRKRENKRAALEAFAQHHSMLLKPMNLKDERYKIYLNWLEDDIFKVLLSGNSDLIDALAALVKKDIELMIEVISNDTATNDS